MKILDKTDSILIQLLRYGISGGVAFMVDFSLLYVLTQYEGFHYLLAGTIGFCAGLIITYLFSIKWIFSQRKYANKKLEFIFFTLIGATGILLNLCFLWFFASFLHIHYLVAKILSTVFVTLWNFFAKKYIIF